MITTAFLLVATSSILAQNSSIEAPDLNYTKKKYAISFAQNRSYEYRDYNQRKNQVPVNRSGENNLTSREMEQIQRGIDRQVQSSDRGLVRRGFRE